MVKEKMTAVILAGGRASRMGFCDKAFLEIGGRSLIDRQLEVLRKLFKKIVIVTNSPDKYRRIKGVEVISDIIPHQGPLGGIYSGLKTSKDRYNFIFACDMPFLNESLIRYMMKKKNGYDVIIPKVEKRFHPLFGIYSKNCIPIIEEMLKRDMLKISGIFPEAKTHFISKKDLNRFDKGMFSLVNINTKNNLKTVKARLK